MATNSTATSSTSLISTKSSKKRKAEDSVDNQSSDNTNPTPKKEKDRIKTLEQFQTELNLLMKTTKEHEESAAITKQKFHEKQYLRARIVPFMLDNLKQTRVDCSAYKMYISTSVVNRQRKVQIQDIYEIIEETLGSENKELIKKKAQELRAQKVASRQIVIKKISDERAQKKKKKEEEAKAAALAGRPIEKKRAKKQ